MHNILGGHVLLQNAQHCTRKSHNGLYSVPFHQQPTPSNRKYLHLETKSCLSENCPFRFLTTALQAWMNAKLSQQQRFLPCRENWLAHQDDFQHTQQPMCDCEFQVDFPL